MKIKNFTKVNVWGGSDSVTSDSSVDSATLPNYFITVSDDRDDDDHGLDDGYPDDGLFNGRMNGRMMGPDGYDMGPMGPMGPDGYGEGPMGPGGYGEDGGYGEGPMGDDGYGQDGGYNGGYNGGFRGGYRGGESDPMLGVTGGIGQIADWIEEGGDQSDKK